MTQAATTTAAPALELKTETLRYNEAPYYTGVVLTDLKLVPNANVKTSMDLIGRAVSGTETARLFHATSSKSVAGQEFRIYGIEQWELDAGEARRAYCG